MGHSGAAVMRVFGYLLIVLTASTMLCATPRAAAQSPAPASSRIAVTGQVLDFEQGFLFFTTGDGFRVDAGASITDIATKARWTGRVRARSYVRATFDTTTGKIVSVEISSRPLPPEAGFDKVRNFAVALSTPAPNPDLDQSRKTPGRAGGQTYREALTGLPVIVTFEVQVPPNTPFADRVYITTDQSGWNPQAIRMDRIDALHYRVVKHLNSGTIFHYRYTRGSPTTIERAMNGLEAPARLMEVTNLDVKNRSDIVYHWSDETLSGQPSNPLAVPTPFNPNPFGNLPQNPKRPVPTPPPH